SPLVNGIVSSACKLGLLTTSPHLEQNLAPSVRSRPHRLQILFAMFLSFLIVSAQPSTTFALRLSRSAQGHTSCQWPGPRLPLMVFYFIYLPADVLFFGRLSRAVSSRCYAIINSLSGRIGWLSDQIVY